MCLKYFSVLHGDDAKARVVLLCMTVLGGAAALDAMPLLLIPLPYRSIAEY
jgi:hypothetical protein